MVIVSVLGIGYISYRFMLRPLEYLDEVSEAAQKLAHPTDAPIVLPGSLKSMEDDLNKVRVRTLESLNPPVKRNSAKMICWSIWPMI